MASKNVETVRAAYENWNKRDFDALASTLAENVTYVDHARSIKLSGRKTFRDFVETWAKAFPDGRITNPQYLDAGDTVVAQFTVEGTNNGTFLGLPASGRRISAAFCEICKFDSSGRAVAGAIYYDMYSILTQLGHVKSLAIAA